MKRLIWGVAALHLALLPCFADVIPTRRVGQDATAERTLQSRLEQLGMSAAEAEHHVRDLSPGETDYFSRHPERVQVTGALEWSEWLLGIAGFILFAGVIALVLS
jgi:hypothetical protein